jgi:hypothetical protein
MIKIPVFQGQGPTCQGRTRQLDDILRREFFGSFVAVIISSCPISGRAFQKVVAGALPE